MSSSITKFVEGLKQRLADNKDNYLEHRSMLGDTEGGFYSTDEFEFEKLIAEIDKFSAEFIGPSTSRKG